MNLNKAYNTHALPCSKQGRDADEETQECQRSPASVGPTESDDDGIDQSANDATNTKPASKRLSRRVAVADGPADEVGVCLVAEGPLDSGNDFAESRRMGGDRKGLEEHRSLSGREIEFARATVGNVDGNDARNLFTEGLHSEGLQGINFLKGLSGLPGVVGGATAQGRAILAPANSGWCNTFTIVAAGGAWRSVEGIVAILLDWPGWLKVSALQHIGSVDRDFLRLLLVESLLLCRCLFGGPLRCHLLLMLGHLEEAFEIVLVPQEELQILSIVLDVLEKVHELSRGHRL
jgi:hypothetical protein